MVGWLADLCFQVWKEHLDREHREIMLLSGDERKQAEKTVKDKRIHPIDAPKGSLRARLLKQMTATESSSKVAVSDLIFNLCNDEGEFVTATVRVRVGHDITVQPCPLV